MSDGWRAASPQEIAAFLGLTSAYIRQVVIGHGIKPTGRRGNAKLYNPHDIIEAIGARHRPHAAQRARTRANLRSTA